MEKNTNNNQANPSSAVPLVNQPEDVLNNNQPENQTQTSAVAPALKNNEAVQGTVTKSVSGSPDYQLATLTKRSYAVFIDGLIVTFVSIALNLPYYITLFKKVIDAYQQGITPTMQSLDVSTPLYNFLSILSSLFAVAYYVYFIGKSGATPGKRMFKIKVIDKETHQAPGYVKAFLREIVGKFISSIVLFIGYLWAVWDKDKQAWHDKIAGTIVIVNN